MIVQRNLESPDLDREMAQRGSDEESVEEQAARVARDWVQSAYYEDAERWTFLFWRETDPFRQLFERMDLTHVVELACGHGRHAEMFKTRAQQITLLDILDENVAYCQKRYADAKHITPIRNSGVNFAPLPDDTVTGIFCYDAMVHFPPAVVESYVKDAYRILRRSGHALFHHSNYGIASDQHYGGNPHARNYMTQQLFCEFARRSGFEIEASQVIPWGDVPDLDCVTLLRKN